MTEDNAWSTPDTVLDDGISFEYDTLGRLATESSSVGGKAIGKNYSYNQFGAETGFTLTVDGIAELEMISAYDDFLRLKSVTQDGKTTTYTYDDNGNLATETTGNVVTTYTYNDSNMVLTMTTTKGNANVTNFVYNYYTDGNQRAKVDTINNVTTAYTYDGAGQLKSEVKTGSVNQTDLYWYDASGNRTLKNEYRTNEDGNTTSKFIRSTYNEMNQLVSSVDSSTNETTTYTYDTYGNLVNDGEFAYSYDDYFNRLKYVHNLETNELTLYDYYVDGLRKSKDNTYFIWLDGNMVYEFTGNNSDTYTYGHRLLYSDYNAYVLNAHGDVVATFWEDAEHCAYWEDEEGNVQEFLYYVDVINETYDYDAFGNELNPSTYDTNPFRYCAEYFDKETGQIYLRNRYYQPVTGRFSQLDPIRDGLNWYAYCGNNPITFVDTTGLYYILGNGTGVYRVVPSNYFFATLSALVPNYISYEVESNKGVISGTSKTDIFDSQKSVVNEMFSLLLNGDGSVITNKTVRLFGERIGFISTIADMCSVFVNINSVMEEEVIFDLVDRHGYSLSSNSYHHVLQFMKTTESYISDNADYYSTNIGGVNKTMYEIDKSLRKSSNPSKLINKYTQDYEVYLRNNSYSADPKAHAAEFKYKLKKYNERLSAKDAGYEHAIDNMYNSHNASFSAG